jgi:uncharacterized membrane protein YfcA
MAAGLIAGFAGIGGGVVLTPIALIVYPLLGANGDDLVKVIFGTNMFLVTALSISSALRHWRNGRMDWRTALFMGPFAVLGAIAGSLAASASNPLLLKKGFALLLIVSSVLVAFGGSAGTSGPREKKPLLPRNALPVLGLFTGFLGSLLGIGGGVVMIPALILLFGLPAGLVAGTSSAVIIFIGAAGTIAYMFAPGTALPGWSTGFVWWTAAIPLMMGGVPAAVLGARLNARTRTKALKRVFGVVLFVLALRILLT